MATRIPQQRRRMIPAAHNARRRYAPSGMGDIDTDAWYTGAASCGRDPDETLGSLWDTIVTIVKKVAGGGGGGPPVTPRWVPPVPPVPPTTPSTDFDTGGGSDGGGGLADKIRLFAAQHPDLYLSDGTPNPKYWNPDGHMKDEYAAELSNGGGGIGSWLPGGMAGGVSVGLAAVVLVGVAIVAMRKS